jgi:DNA-binding transcriptional LysR family regulator
MLDWNDLKYLVALAEHGSTLAAARALQVNASTVQRRLLELEERIGQPLVRRESTGYHLTDYGRETHSAGTARGRSGFGPGAARPGQAP